MKVKDSKKLLFFIMCVFMVFGFACTSSKSGSSSSSSSSAETGYIKFNVSGSTLQSKLNIVRSVLRSTTATKEDAAKLLVSIEDDSGNVIYTDKELTLYAMGSDFISAPLSLEIGKNYSLTKFLVVDKNNNTLFATPTKDSTKASLVTNPLPISLNNITKDATVKTTPEVIAIDTSSAQEFGYGSFDFTIIDTFKILMAVQIYNSTEKNWELTTSDYEFLSSDNKTLNSGSLEAETSVIYLPHNGYSEYTLKVTKTGFETYQNTFSLTVIKNYTNDPLIVLLKNNDDELTGTGSEEDPYILKTCTHLQNIDENTGKYFYYTLGNDIDCSDTKNWNSGEGFKSIAHFTGSLNGNNKVISNLYINRPNESQIGFLGYADGNSVIKDLQVTNVNINGKDRVGGIVGHAYSNVEISNCVVTGDISGENYIGGLIGEMTTGIKISDSNTNININGKGGSYIGGFVGSTNNSQISNSYSEGDIVTGDNNKYIGGFVGSTNNSQISNSYSEGDIVTGDNNDYIGGFIGKMFLPSQISNSYSKGKIIIGNNNNMIGGFSGFNDGTISNSYSIVNITIENGNSLIGGFSGYNFNFILNSYSKGNIVTGDNNSFIGGFNGRNAEAIYNSYSTSDIKIGNKNSRIGGFIGMANTPYINSCLYSTGKITIGVGNHDIGGFLGYNNSYYNPAKYSYWDKETSGVTNSDDGIGKTTAEMKLKSTYEGWNFETIWKIDEGNSYPKLIWED